MIGPNVLSASPNWAGNEAAYQQHQQIRAANNIAQMQERTALLNAEAAADWGGAWGPAAPYWN